jgi:AcrR family transcriptional regulator
MPPRAAVAPSRQAPSTRDLILDAAEGCFAERGFPGVSMRAIASEAGLRNQASLYHHFKDKRALYEAVLARGIGTIVGLVSQHPAAGAPAPFAPGTVDAVLDRLLDYLEEHPHLPRLIQRAGIDDARHLRGTISRLLRPLYAQGMAVLGVTGSAWERADLPQVAAGIYHLIFGYFANAALIEVVEQRDPRSPAALARHRRFTKIAIAQLLDAPQVRPLRRRRV